MYFGKKKIEKIEQEHIIPLQSEINKTLFVFFLGICCCCYCCEYWDCVLYATFSVFSNIVYIFCWLVINFHGALLIALLCKKKLNNWKLWAKWKKVDTPIFSCYPWNEYTLLYVNIQKNIGFFFQFFFIFFF